MIRVLRIDQSHPLYEQEVALREKVLLEPIGLDMEGLEQLFPGAEAAFEHVVAVVDHPSGERVVGVVCLLPDYPEKGTAKLMQMVVDPQRQKEGIGRRLVAELERRAFGELGLTSLWCSARDTAVDFYKSMGWSIEGDEYREAGIPHFKMVFDPPADHRNPQSAQSAASD